jgi:hypothetical protein
MKLNTVESGFLSLFSSEHKAVNNFGLDLLDRQRNWVSILAAASLDFQSDIRSLKMCVLENIVS